MRAVQTFVREERRPSPPASPRLTIRPLMADDIWLDYPCCVRNAQHIRDTRGGDWPGESLTWHDDLIDLAFHRRSSSSADRSPTSSPLSTDGDVRLSIHLPRGTSLQ